MRTKGRVKWYDDTKGYGFITLEDKSGDVFVHQSAVAGSGRQLLQTGKRVEFEVVATTKGPQAINVTPATE